MVLGRAQADHERDASLPVSLAVPAVSVVIPAFNAAGFIRDALDSVVAQTFRDYEVVVVDDGSEDDTVSCVAAWGHAHPAMPLNVLRREHAGISAARNAGIQAAAADYVAFLDADDLWTPRKLEAIMTRLSRPNPPDLICHDEWLEEGGARKGPCRHGPYTTYRDLLFKGNCISTSAVVARRDLLLRVGGFSPDLTCGMEDYDLWLRLAAAGSRLEYVHEFLGVYRRLGQGITSKIQQHCEEGLAVLAAHYGRWQEQTSYYGYLVRRRRAAMLRGACRSFMGRGAHREAGRFWRRALVEDPLSWKTWTLGVLNLVHVQL